MNLQCKNKTVGRFSPMSCFGKNDIIPHKLTQNGWRDHCVSGKCTPSGAFSVIKVSCNNASNHGNVSEHFPTVKISDVRRAYLSKTTTLSKTLPSAVSL